MGSVLLKWLKHSKQLLCHSLYCSWVWQGTGIFFLSISLSLPPPSFSLFLLQQGFHQILNDLIMNVNFPALWKGKAAIQAAAAAP